MAENQQRTQAQRRSPVGGTIVLLVALVAIVWALVLGGMRYFGDSNTDPNDDPNNPGDGEGDTSFQTTLWPADWQKLNTFTAGTLLPGTDASYVPAPESLTVMAGGTQGAFGYPNSDTKMDKAAFSKLVAMFLALNDGCSYSESNDINRAYTAESSDEYKTALTVRIRLKKEDGTNVLLANATVTGGERPDKWMETNAWKYGFIDRFPNSESDGTRDVYRYVGVPHAYYITNVLANAIIDTEVDGTTAEDTAATGTETETEAETTGNGGQGAGQALRPTLDTYLELVRTKTAKNPLVIEVKGALTVDQAAQDAGPLEKAGNGTYGVFYVKKADAEQAQVPMNSQLVSVSDDGAGYIVTVKLTDQSESEK